MIRQQIIQRATSHRLLRDGFVSLIAQDQNWHVGIGGEQAHVLERPGRVRVVVAAPDVAVPTHVIAFAPHHQ